jgi:hypothetical protein
MNDNQIQTIPLTREQQLEVLAATGLLVKTLEVDASAIEADGTISARIPLPTWLVEEPVAGQK